MVLVYFIKTDSHASFAIFRSLERKSPQGFLSDQNSNLT